MADTSYSKVIFRNRDPESEDIVNSFKYKSVSPIKHRMYSADIAEEDRFRKKKIREDFYIKDLEKDTRPVLVIKKKEVFENLQSPEMSIHPLRDDRFYKITKNTSTIDSMEEQLRNQQLQAKRETIVSKPRNASASPNRDNAAKMFKIQGIEFLPEGFLELDPLLYKDEYMFDNQFNEKRFEEEQRRLKALRRRQYDQRNEQKQREVTIFVVDEQKDKILEYFERWYFKNKRKMDAEEIAHTAELLNSPPELIQNLQDLYLKRAKLMNEETVRQLLKMPYETRKHRLSNVPFTVQKLLLGVDGFNKEERARPSMAQQPKSSRHHKPEPNASKNPSLTESGLNQSSATAEMRNYYDSMINNIIGEIKERNMSNPQNIDQLATQALRPSKAAPKKSTVEEHKDALNAIDPTQFPNTLSARNLGWNMQQEPLYVSLVGKSRDGSRVTKQTLKPSLVNDQYYFHQITDFIDPSGQRAMKMVTRDENGEVVAEHKLDPKLSGIYQSFVSRSNASNEPKTVLRVINNAGQTVAIENHGPAPERSIDGVSFDNAASVNDPTGRKTVVFQKKSHNGELKVFKLRPTLIGDEYYIQMVKELTQGDQTHALLVTRDLNGCYLSEIDLTPHQLAASYVSHVADEFIENDQRSFILVTTNDRGEIVGRQTITPQPTGTIGDHLFEELGEETVGKNGDVQKLAVFAKDDDARFAKALALSIRPKKRLDTIDEENDNEEGVPDSVLPDQSAFNRYYSDLINEVATDIKKAKAGEGREQKSLMNSQVGSESSFKVRKSQQPAPNARDSRLNSKAEGVQPSRLSSRASKSPIRQSKAEPLPKKSADLLHESLLLNSQNLSVKQNWENADKGLRPSLKVQQSFQNLGSAKSKANIQVESVKSTEELRPSQRNPPFKNSNLFGESPNVSKIDNLSKLITHEGSEAEQEGELLDKLSEHNLSQPEVHSFGDRNSKLQAQDPAPRQSSNQQSIRQSQANPSPNRISTRQSQANPSPNQLSTRQSQANHSSNQHSIRQSQANH